MGYLTTHILDTTQGVAAAGVHIHLYKHTDEGRRIHLHSTISNHDGRCDAPLLDVDQFSCGIYELEFAIDDYFAQSTTNEPHESLSQDGTLPTFLNTVVIRFGINDEQAHYHIPLLVSPFAYSTYRGS
ncbi:hydroxyisourate hydrolase [Marinomonas algarum]|uniref:5-hydroxyisourate hydrolase n=1 Tax=Marinomonas algarum TaxID=2883105 RepID=A0A9X1LE78_9GAMM|nr:hydroxyisourate hydrolase [Marinomonas algarum]MCB5160690.1 hydroxyisourate hydrolase [Marinomonas algarum]